MTGGRRDYGTVHAHRARAQMQLADQLLNPRREALLARRWLNFPGACTPREPEPKLCVAFQQARLSTHRHHLTRSHLIMPSAPPQLPSSKNRQPPLGKGPGVRSIAFSTAFYPAKLNHSNRRIGLIPVPTAGGHLLEDRHVRRTIR